MNGRHYDRRDDYNKRRGDQYRPLDRKRRSASPESTSRAAKQEASSSSSSSRDTVFGRSKDRANGSGKLHDSYRPAATENGYRNSNRDHSSSSSSSYKPVNDDRDWRKRNFEREKDDLDRDLQTYRRDSIPSSSDKTIKRSIENGHSSTRANGNSHNYPSSDKSEEDGLQKLWIKENEHRQSRTSSSKVNQAPPERRSLANRMIDDIKKDEKKPLISARTPFLLPHELALSENAHFLPRTAKGEILKSFKVTYDPELDEGSVKKHKNSQKSDLENRASKEDPRLSAPKRKARKDLRILHWKWDIHSTKDKPLPPSRSLVISNLSPLANLAMVRNHFRSFGRLEDFELKYDPSTGASTGICFLTYSHDFDDDMKVIQGIDESKAQKGEEIAKKAHSASDGQKIGSDTIKVEFDDLARTLFQKSFEEFVRSKKEAIKASKAAAAAATTATTSSALKENLSSSPASISAHYHQIRSPATTSNMPPPIAPRVIKLMQNDRSQPRSPGGSNDVRNYDRNRNASGYRHSISSSSPSSREQPAQQYDREAARHQRNEILHRLKEIGNPYAYVSNTGSRSINKESLNNLFAAFLPAWIESDDRGYYIAFAGRQDAERARNKLDCARILGDRVRIDVRQADDSRSNKEAREVVRIPVKTSWTDEELVKDAKLLLLRELGVAFVRDLRTRVLDRFVTDFLDPKKGKGGSLLQEFAAATFQNVEEEIEIDYNEDRPKSFNKAAQEERRQKAIAAKKEAERRQRQEEEQEQLAETKRIKAAQIKATKASKKVAKVKERSLSVSQSVQSSRTPSPLPEVYSINLSKDEEELYYYKKVLELVQSGLPMPEIDNEELDQEIFKSPHNSGSARTEGFYRIPAAEKGKHLAERNLGAAIDVGGATNVALASARDNRADSRRFVQGIEQHKKETATDTDILKFNQLRSRKKQLKFAKSPIHDWGLYAVEQIPAGDMVIEYVGEIVRQQVADEREKNYERQGNFSTYLFRVDDDIVVDATKKGNIARLMNHCCTPNCNARILTLNGEKRIVLFAKSTILPGQELTYDYKFQATGDEEDAIACLCGSSGCRGFL